MKVDMPPKAISTRLKLVSQLHRLCLSLAEAKPVQFRPRRGFVERGGMTEVRGLDSEQARAFTEKWPPGTPKTPPNPG
jgi:hypothetical protein